MSTPQASSEFAPPTPPPPTASARGGGDGFAVTALILGLSALVLATIPFACFAAFPVVVAAAVCGIVGAVRGTGRRTESFLGLGASGLALLIAALVGVSTFQQLPAIARGFDDAGGLRSLGEELDQLTEPDTGPLLTPDPVELRGTGDDTVAVVPADGADQYGYAHITAQGTGVFSVVGLDAAGDDVEYIVDVQAPYDGYVLWNTDAEAVVTTFEVVADDAWGISIMGLGTIPELAGDSSRRGVGDVVFVYYDEATEATLETDDESDTSTWMWSTSGPPGGLCDAFVSAVCRGPLDGEGQAELLQIYADSGWTLTVGGAPAGSSTT